MLIKLLKRFLNKHFYWTGWGIAKNSEFAGLLNHWLHKFDESGIRDRLWKWWNFDNGEQFGVDEAITLGFENITFPFLFIVEGLAAAAVFLVLEICSLKKGSKNKEDEDRFMQHMNGMMEQPLKLFDMDGQRHTNVEDI